MLNNAEENMVYSIHYYLLFGMFLGESFAFRDGRVLKKHVRLSRKSRTCFSGKHVHVFLREFRHYLMRLQPVLLLAAIGDQGDL